MTAGQRWEGRLALAMLPVGAFVLLASALAVPAVAALGIDVAVRQVDGWDWTLAWSVAAIGLSVWNMRTGIAIMSAFDWRPLPLALVRSAVATAGWLALP